MTPVRLEPQKIEEFKDFSRQLAEYILQYKVVNNYLLIVCTIGNFRAVSHLECVMGLLVPIYIVHSVCLVIISERKRCV